MHTVNTFDSWETTLAIAYAETYLDEGQALHNANKIGHIPVVIING
jgi:hypothetical protein